MSEDLELKAMSAVYESVRVLDPEARTRVMNWLWNKLEIQSARHEQKYPVAERSAPEASVEEITSFGTIAEAFAHSAPTTDVGKVLLVSAYLQEKHERPELTGREINSELHNLGYRVGNITSSLSCLINRKPQFIIQTRKEGKSQQAQKKYKVTIAGLKAAKAMLSSHSSSSDQITGNN